MPQQSSKFTRPQLDPFLLGLTKLDNEKKLVQMLLAEGSDTSSTSEGLSADSDDVLVRPATSSFTPLASIDNLVGGSGASSGITAPVKSTITPPPASLDHPYIVIIRHGKTEYNKLGLFTGWEGKISYSGS